MNIKNLMSGIAVVIDDAYETEGEILRLIQSIENEWKVPCYKTHEIPSAEICNNLIQSASFILLDWKLWPNGTDELKKSGIKANNRFLEQAKGYFVPVFIFTNENKHDVVHELNQDLYDNENPGQNFIFIEKKEKLLSEFSRPMEEWLQGNASVYTLKTWEQAFYKAKGNLFGSMYGKSPDWPKVFWKAYKGDGIDPSFSMVNLINSNLIARTETNIFEEKILDKSPSEIDSKDLTSVLEGASFIPQEKLPVRDIKAGDIFKKNPNNYLINIRADCDCIPRNNQHIDKVGLYCIEGKSIAKEQVKELYDCKLGNFNERVWQAIVFMVDDGKTIRFDLRKIAQKEFGEIKNDRVGRLIHPHITRIQQRYSAYLQRQGLPRIPKEAIETDGET